LRLRPGAVGVQNYLAALKRVEQKLSNLRSSNFRINQEATKELEGLITYGLGELETLYKALIKEDVTPIEPLHYITKRRYHFFLVNK
jgi:exocyst complex protein 7